MEIERKWMVKGFPETLVCSGRAVMRQGYISTRPTVRIREKTGAGEPSYVLCFKGPGTLAREEIETDISAELFARLERFIGKPLITKDYRVYALGGGLTLEVSRVDEGLPTEFCYAEVEFDSVEAAHAFDASALPFLGEELTEVPGSSMSAYWERTRGEGTGEIS